MVITEVKTEGPDTTTYTAVLTEPADADLQLKIRLIIQDDTFANCATAWFDLDIATGLSTATWRSRGAIRVVVRIGEYLFTIRMIQVF